MQCGLCMLQEDSGSDSLNTLVALSSALNLSDYLLLDRPSSTEEEVGSFAISLQDVEMS